jgi:hypothetical protein
MPHRVNLNCTQVSPHCPVENTIYGYAPNLGLNAFFIAMFALFALAQIFFGTKHKTFFFAYAITMGCIGEAIGYGGRIIMHSNPVDILIPAYLCGEIIVNIIVVFVPRVQDPNRVLDIRPSIHRSRHLPDPETHCTHIRPREKQDQSSLLHNWFHNL